MLILGISGLSHQSTAALLKDGEIVAACEEAKLIGRRSPAGVPHKAIAFCLSQAGAKAEDIDGVAADLQPLRLAGRELSFRGRRVPAAPMSGVFQKLAGKQLQPEIRELRALEDTFTRAHFTAVDHYYALAAYAYYPSSFDRALILTLDSSLASRSAAIALGEGDRIKQLATAAFPHSVGLVFGEITKLLGWDQVEDTHRTAWLSTTGEPEFAEPFRHIFAPMHRGELKLNADCFNLNVAGHIRLSEKFLASIGATLGKKPADMAQSWRANVAASLQSEAEAAVVKLAEIWREKTKTKQLCFSGGVAFNALMADALATHTGFADGFIPPAAGNAGCAIGAAMAATQAAGQPVKRCMMSASLGPSYSGQQIKDILDNCRLRYTHLSLPQMVETVAELLAEGLFVGWFEGAAEFGPRALGNRSILAAPRDHWVKENLNAYTKRRETFRPLAASVTREAASRYFDYRWPDAAAYLATLARVKDAASIPGLAFQGNRARIQMVTRASNRYYHELLTRVGQLTGHPVLINTSFNEPGAPLAATPGEALRVFFSSGIDVLALGNFLIRK